MKKLLLTIIIIMLFALSGCVEETKSLCFDEEKVSIQINESIPLPLTLNNINIKEVTFSYTNNSIIDLSDDIIIPLAIGETVVTASYGDISDSIVIEVTKILPNIKVVKNVLEIGQSVKLSISNYDIENFNWEISDPGIVEMSNNYVIKALEIGTTTITAINKEDSNIKNSISIEVIPYQPEISATINVLRIGDTSQVVITNLDSTGYSMEDYEWVVSDESIITLDDNYVVTALNVGQATITATLKENEKCFSSYSFTITTPTNKKTSFNEPAEGPLIFELENNKGIVQAGEDLEVNIIGANSKYNYYWMPDDTSIARVTENGKVLGAKAGRTKVVVISKEDENIRGEFYVTVTGVSNVNYREKIVQIGLDEAGYHEGINNANKYGVWYRYENVAWCAIFVSWCANEAGVGTDVILRYCLCSEGVRWFEEQGNYRYRGEYEPLPGDIIFFQSNGNVSHTGIVTNCDGEKVYTIEGNTSNGVYEREYSLDDTYIHGYGIPNYPEYQK